MDHPEASPPSHPGRLLRPYALTRGRARPSHGTVVEIEALVSTTVIGETMHMPAPEPHSIALLCREPLSVAEIADQGMVEVHRPSQFGTGPDVTLLERVLDGLRRV